MGANVSASDRKNLIMNFDPPYWYWDLENLDVKFILNKLEYAKNNSVPIILTNSIPSGIEQTNYSAILTGSGGKTPYIWMVSGLPIGLTCSTSGVISGISTVTGNFPITVYLTDNIGQEAVKNLVLIINSLPTLVINNASLPSGTEHTSYSVTLRASGGKPPYTWETSQLPNNLELNSNTGIISGNPTEVGNFPININVKDSED
jgi:hypothetical protein